VVGAPQDPDKRKAAYTAACAAGHKIALAQEDFAQLTTDYIRLQARPRANLLAWHGECDVPDMHSQPEGRLQLASAVRELKLGDGYEMDIVWAVSNAQRASASPQPRQGNIIGDTRAAMCLDGRVQHRQHR
jgi:hypothetical protein